MAAATNGVAADGAASADAAAVAGAAGLFGVKINGWRICSLGFADDTWVASSTRPGIRRLHDITVRWLRWHFMRLNAVKTQLIGTAEDGGSAWVNDPGPHAIIIEGAIVGAKLDDESIRYLGCQMRRDCSSEPQIAKLSSTLGMYRHAIIRHELRADRAVGLVNEFLVPALNYSIGLLCTSQGQLLKWDNQLARAISLAAGTGGRVIAADVIACITGCMFPSVAAPSALIGDMHVTLNDPRTVASHVSRLCWRLRSDKSVRQRCSRHVHAEKAAAELGWRWTMVPSDAHGVPVEMAVPSHPADRSRKTELRCDVVDGKEGNPNGPLRETVLVTDYHGVWGTRENAEWKDARMAAADHSASPPVVELATDGSFIVSPIDLRPRSSWSVCVIDDYLLSEFGSFPSDEILYTNDTVRGCAVLGGLIPATTSNGIFMAELHAVYRALVLLPAGHSLRLWIDSQSVIAAIARYTSGSVSVRERLRTSGRPLLELISRLIVARRVHGAGATVEFAWQRAHTSDMTVTAVANRIADFAAKRAIHWVAVRGSRGAAAVLVPPAPADLYDGDVIAGDEKRSGSRGSERRLIRQERAAHAALSRSRSSDSGGFFEIPLLFGEDFVGIEERIGSNSRGRRESKPREGMEEKIGGKRLHCRGSAPGNHDLKWYINIEGYSCDICGDEVAEAWMCARECGYEICELCFDKETAKASADARRQRDVADSDGTSEKWRLISGDIRRECRRVLRTQQQHQWARSTSQSLFAPFSPIVTEYWQCIVRDTGPRGLALHSSFFLRAMANVLHFTNTHVFRRCSGRDRGCRQSRDGGVGEVDGVADDVQHIVRCDRGTRIADRHQMVLALLALCQRPEWQSGSSQQQRRVVGVDGGDSGPSLGEFATGWPARQPMVLGCGWNLFEFLMDMGLISPGSVLVPGVLDKRPDGHSDDGRPGDRKGDYNDHILDEGLRPESSTPLAAASAASATLSMLGGFTPSAITSACRRWAIPEDRRLTFITAVRLILPRVGTFGGAAMMCVWFGTRLQSRHQRQWQSESLSLLLFGLQVLWLVAHSDWHF